MPLILLFVSTRNQAKSISYPAKLTFGCSFLTKNPRGRGDIFLHQFHDWKDFLFVRVCVCMRLCMCVCLCVYVCLCMCVITLQVTISILLAPNLVQGQFSSTVKLSLKMGYIGSIVIPRELHHKSYILVIFQPQAYFQILRCHYIGFIKT